MMGQTITLSEVELTVHYCCIPNPMDGAYLPGRRVYATTMARYAGAVEDERGYRMVDVPGAS